MDISDNNEIGGSKSMPLTAVNVGHVIFSYNVNRPLRSPRHPSSSGAQHSFSSQTNSGADDEFSLSLCMNNVPLETRLEVHDFITKKMMRGYTGTGQTMIIGSHACYFCLVRNDEALSNSNSSTNIGNNSKEEEFSSSPVTPTISLDNKGTLSHEYVICFLQYFNDMPEDGIDLFRPELDDYCKIVAKLLFEVEKTGSSWLSDEKLRQMLENWFSVNLGYVERCIEFFGTELDTLLYYALEGKKLVITGTSKFAEDVAKFFRATSIVHMLSQEGDIKSLQASRAIIADSYDPDDEETIHLHLTDTTLQFNRKKANAFCTEWASKLQTKFIGIRQSIARNPHLEQTACIILRKLLETEKTKIIQEVNSFKRLIRKSEIDHYAMYHCVKTLMANPNYEILISLLCKDNTLVEDGRDVLLAIQEYNAGK